MRIWGSIFLIFAVFAAPSYAGQKKPQDAFCHDQHLTRQEQSVCVDRVAGVESMDELKKLQARYRDKAKAREEAEKNKK